jgi:hypothetical protein
MSHWLDPVRAALDSRATPVTFFIRDDDAGWADERLFRLIDLTQWHHVPIDVAAIPTEITPGLARELRRAVDESAGLIAVHQHGYSHLNHEENGKKCEFGPSRSLAQQRADIARGRRILEDMIGAPLASIFTPPWNRCTPDTAVVLGEIGCRLLSRDIDAANLGMDRVRELPVCLDWSGRHGLRTGPEAWGQSMANAIARSTAATTATAATEPVGLMLHHAVMTADDRRLLSEWLELVAAHPMVRLRPMLDCPGVS